MDLSHLNSRWTDIKEIILAIISTYLNPLDIFSMSLVCHNWKQTLLRKDLFHILIRNSTVALLDTLSVPLTPIYYLCKRASILSGGAVAQAIQCDFNHMPKDIDIFVPLFDNRANSIDWPHVTTLFAKKGFQLNLPATTQGTYGSGFHFADSLLLSNLPNQYVSIKSRVQATFQFVRNNTMQFNERTIIQIILMYDSNATSIVDGFDINICKSFVSILPCRNKKLYCSMECQCSNKRRATFGSSPSILYSLCEKTFRYDKVERLKRLLIQFQTSPDFLEIRMSALQRIEKYRKKGYRVDSDYLTFYQNLKNLSTEPTVTFHTDEQGNVTRFLLFDVL